MIAVVNVQLPASGHARAPRDRSILPVHRNREQLAAFGGRHEYVCV